MKTSILLLCLSAFATTALPDQPSTNLTASTLARSALLGIQLSMKKGHKDGKVSNANAQCMQSIDQSALTPAFASALEESWQATDVQAVDRFLSTPVGAKYAKDGLLQVYEYAAEPLPEPRPAFSNSERAQLEAFARTEAGHKFLTLREFESPHARQTVKAAMRSLLHSCGFGT